jgi:hydroxymethylglutaryl-CoA synthase
MAALVGYGTYLPAWRLDRAAIRSLLGSGGGKGARAVAGYDEDVTSMGVEAARALLAGSSFSPDTVLFATTAPPYLDKTNATAIHAALGLPASVAAFDMVGSVRSGTGAVQLAAGRAGSTLVVASDVRTGLPGGADEAAGGDGAVALAFGDRGDPLVELMAGASSTGEFLDRWRVPGELASRQWEERFGESAYLPLAQAAVTEALKTAELTADGIDHLVVSGAHARAVKGVRAWIGARKEAVAPDLTAQLGHLGAAHADVALADVLDRAAAGEVIVLVTLADGADVAVLRATDALPAYRQGRPTVAAAAAAGQPVDYASFLTWRDVLRREPPRRPDPQAPAAPPSLRNEAWKFALEASRCEACGTRHLPPARVCLSCHAVDQMAPERLADVPATIATYTVDRLAFSLAPPVVSAVIDFDGGGRFQCELADVAPDEVAIGGRVRMTFRRMYTAGNGVHDYFWKARPILEREV